jgi:hypothetical protein
MLIAYVVPQDASPIGFSGLRGLVLVLYCTCSCSRVDVLCLRLCLALLCCYFDWLRTVSDYAYDERVWPKHRMSTMTVVTYDFDIFDASTLTRDYRTRRFCSPSPDNVIVRGKVPRGVDGARCAFLERLSVRAVFPPSHHYVRN